MSSKRTKKFYNNNEKKVMKRLGLKPTFASGAGWVEKEDGYNDYIVAQHKSTDAESYRLTQLDLHKLEYHAILEKKLPLFVIEFLNNGEIYLVIKPNDLCDIVNYINVPKRSSEVKLEPQIDIEYISDIPKRKTISSGNSKQLVEDMKIERDKKYQKK